MRSDRSPFLCLSLIVVERRERSLGASRNIFYLSTVSISPQPSQLININVYTVIVLT